MDFSSSSFLRRPFFIFFFFCFIPPECLSDPRISEAGLLCGTARPPANVSYIPLFVRTMEVLSQRVTANGWGVYALNSTNISIYTLAQCYADLSYDDCLQCYAASRTRLPRCLPAVSGRIFLDGCFLRYDNYNFFNESLDPRWDTVNCTMRTRRSVDSRFAANAGRLIDNLVAATASKGRFATAGRRGVFGLANCWNSTSPQECRSCLAEANSGIRRCLPSAEGRALNTGCYLRYSTERFFSNHTDGSTRNSGISRTGRILAVFFSILAALILCVVAFYAALRKWRKRKQERSNLGKIERSYNKSSLNFKYEALEKATNYFDITRKVGQGGAGSVFRGVLQNGKTVAVKRLFFSTRQWVDEFFNEVNLLTGIEHKNLVKLLGCSIEGPESLLVYEFVPNHNLEQYLFGEEKVKVLSWKERYEIIVGTAEGIAFLHGGSGNRIIHRDIKCSNVLLDENFHPKIADFGLVRYLGADKTHLSTGIAGTLGYMAPEYLVKGQLTEKADVYSYGILVLEVISGRKNNAVEESGFGSLLRTVWMLYKAGTVATIVDPCLRGEFPETAATRALKIGLLCAQASLALRPSMEQVVGMLRDESCEIPEPNQPPFLNATAASVSASSWDSNVTPPSEIATSSSRSRSFRTPGSSSSRS